MHNALVAEPGDHIAGPDSAIEGRRTRNYFPDDNAVVVAIVYDDAELLEWVMPHRHILLDQQRRLHADDRFLVLANEQHLDAPLADLGGKKELDKVCLASHFHAVDLQDAISLFESELGNPAGGRNSAMTSESVAAGSNQMPMSGARISLTRNSRRMVRLSMATGGRGSARIWVSSVLTRITAVEPAIALTQRLLPTR